MIKFYNIINNYYNYLKLFKINKILINKFKIKQIMIFIYYNDETRKSHLMRFHKEIIMIIKKNI